MPATAVLAYHALDEADDAVSTSPGWFAETLRVLVGEGWRVVGAGDWRGGPSDSAEGGDRPRLILTFDDGLDSSRRAEDVLTDLGIEARPALFPVAGALGGWNRFPGSPGGGRIRARRLLTASGVEELALRGWEIGAHGWDHRSWIALGDAELDWQLEASARRVEELSGRRCRLAAYPYGDWNARVASSARGRFEGVFSTRHDFLNRDSDDPADLPRLEPRHFRTTGALRALARAGWLEGGGPPGGRWVRASRAAALASGRARRWLGL